MVKVLEVDKELRKISLTMEKEEHDFRTDLNKIKEEQENKFNSKGTMADLFKGF